MSIQECGHFRRHHHKTIRRSRENSGATSKREPQTKSPDFLNYGIISTVHQSNSHKRDEAVSRFRAKNIFTRLSGN